MVEINKLYPQNTKPNRQNMPINFTSINANKEVKYSSANIKDTFEAFAGERTPDKDFKKAPAKKSNNRKIALTALSVLPPARRVSSLEDNLDKHDYVRAAGLATLALINLPEDMRDIKAAAKQINHNVFKDKFKQNIKRDFPKLYTHMFEYKPYNYTTHQHNFSFFKGTLLEPLLKINGPKGKKIARALNNADKNLLNTKFGKIIQNIFKFNYADEAPLFTGRKYGFKNSIGVYAFNFKGSKVGKLLGRSMVRIPVLSVAALSLLELPAIIKSGKKGDSIPERFKEIGKQIAKSINYVGAIFTGIGVGGALFAKKWGSLGSLVGMGLGVITTSVAAKQINNNIDKI